MKKKVGFFSLNLRRKQQNKRKQLKKKEAKTVFTFLPRFPPQCHICSRVLKHNYRDIFHHLGVHKINIKKYAAIYKDKAVGELRRAIKKFVFFLKLFFNYFRTFKTLFMRTTTFIALGAEPSFSFMAEISLKIKFF